MIPSNYLRGRTKAVRGVIVDTVRALTGKSLNDITEAEALAAQRALFEAAITVYEIAERMKRDRAAAPRSAGGLTLVAAHGHLTEAGQEAVTEQRKAKASGRARKRASGS